MVCRIREPDRHICIDRSTDHAYASLTGPDEMDGPAIPNDSNLYYLTYWVAGQQQAVGQVRPSHYASPYWTSYISTTEPEIGTAYALGETPSTSLPMGPAQLTNLEHLYSNGTWYNWPSMITCVDPPYYISSHGANYLVNGG